jgi:hypothetical protein
MKKSNDITWSQFQLIEVFEISATKSSIDRNKLNGLSGRIPYITRTDNDNGIDDFIDGQPLFKTDEGNVITIGLDTQTVFYQPALFYTGQNIQVLRNPHLNKYVALYIIPLIKKQMAKFNWGGNGATLGRLKKLSLYLPCIDSVTPDYQYMEDFMKSVELKLLRRYKNYISFRIGECIKNYKTNNTQCTHWGDFPISDLGKVCSGKDIYEKERRIGRVPYVTSTASQNGIGYFVENNNETLTENCLSVNRNGSVGYAFFHPYKALFGNDTRRLIPYYSNRYSSFYLACAITRQKEKYGYGLKLGTDRLKKQHVVLPIEDNNQPDYVYMSQYMKGLEYKLLTQYIRKRLSDIDQ